MENALTLALEVEVLKALPEGTRVRLPDGETGFVQWSSYEEVHVVQPEKIYGRGPWIFHRCQVEAL